MVRALVGLGFMGAIVAVLSCGSDGQSPSDCPIGTFRPVGIRDCVVPADNPFTSDTRCTSGAQSPQCVSTTGGRAYYATSSHCAPGYQFQMGTCLGNSGVGGSFGDGSFAGTAGAGTAGFDGQVFTGSGGSGFILGADGSFTGASGSSSGFVEGSFADGGFAMPVDAMSEGPDASVARDASDVSGGSDAD